MKTNTHRLANALFALSLISIGQLRAAGSLTPPVGAPTAVMKTLDEVEPRIPLVAGSPGVSIDGVGTLTISQPGSYYLTSNRTITTASAHGIIISANDVTLDFNGFSLICTGVNGGNAVHFSSTFKNTRIRNGTIVGGTTHTFSVFTSFSGWGYGINAIGSTSTRVSDMIIRDTRSIGIELRTPSGTNIVERCTIDGAGSIGIIASVVIDCTSDNNQSDGIWLTESTGIPASVTNSFGRSIVNGLGIDAGNGTAVNCKGVSVNLTGVNAKIATNCDGTSTSGIGLNARTASNSIGASTSNTGLTAEIATNCIGTSTSGTNGMTVTGTASFCRGTRSGGVAINAGIAIGCTTSAGTITSPQKHLGTP